MEGRPISESEEQWRVIGKLQQGQESIFKILGEIKSCQEKQAVEVKTIISDHCDSCTNQMGNHDKRLGSLEGFKEKIIGAAVVVTVGIGAFGAWIISHLPGGAN
jgi:hypothetical protein